MLTYITLDCLFLKGSSAEACRLLKGLLNRDASKRLGSSKGTMFVVGGITELKQSDFFNGLDWRLLELKGNKWWYY